MERIMKGIEGAERGLFIGEGGKMEEVD